MGEYKNQSKISTSFTMLSQLMGAALLSISFITQKMGLILTLVAYALTITTVVFIYKFYIEATHYTGAKSYRNLCEIVVGRRMSILLDVCNIVSYYGYCTSYVIISANSVRSFIYNVAKYTLNAYAVKAVIAVVIIFPLTLLRSLRVLSRIGTFAGLAIFITAFSIIINCFIFLGKKKLCDYQENGETKSVAYHLNIWPYDEWYMGLLVFLMYLPYLHSGFSCHNIIPTFFQDFLGPSLLKKKVIAVSLWMAMGMALFLYLAVGISGAAYAGLTLSGNIFYTFSKCGFLYFDILGLLYAFVVIIAFPLVLFPIKLSIVQFCEIDPASRKGYAIQILISALFVVLSCGLAMLLEEIVVIFGLFSALAGIIYFYYVPIQFFIKLPQLKAENPQADYVEEGTQIVDPAVVGVISTLTGMSVERARALSTMLFDNGRRRSSGGYNAAADHDATRPTRTVSFLRPRVVSFVVKDDGTVAEKYASRANSIQEIQVAQATGANLGSDHIDAPYPRRHRLASIAIAAASEVDTFANDIVMEGVIVETTQTDEERKRLTVPKYNISKQRKAGGWVFFALWFAVCIVGVVMNGIDVYKQFVK